MTDRIPIVEKYRGVGIHDFQDRERVEDVVKPAIDTVYDMNAPAALYEYACDFRHAPEARLFAAAKVRATFEARASAHENRGDIDLERLACCVSGLDKVTVFGMHPDFYWAGGTPSARAPGVWQTLPRRPAHHVARFKAAQEAAQEWERTHRQPVAVGN
jgi:hypothetical protein